MNYLYENQISTEYINDVRKLLFDADKEFVPPLSERESTTQKELDGSKKWVKEQAEEAEEYHSVKPVKYFEGMIKQAFVLAVEDGKVHGFMTFIPDHAISLSAESKDHEEVLNGQAKSVMCDYISTIVVAPERRKQGITKNMYETLFERRAGKSFATRTWSLNKAHIRVLNKLGFKLVKTIKDDRGEGIDTVYYLKEPMTILKA